MLGGSLARAMRVEAAPMSTVDAPVEPGGVTPSDLERIRARGGVRALLPMLGPAFVAAIAYVDPGNFATNIAGGAQFGYLLLWVVLAANLMAMLIQDAVGQARHRHRQATCPSCAASASRGR